MRRSVLLLVIFCAACAPDAPDPKFEAELAEFDARFRSAQAELPKADDVRHARMPDMRGRMMADDLEHWVLTPRSRDAIRRLRDQAARSGKVAPLEEARQLINDEVKRRMAILEYWREFPAPFWREHWRRFAQANDLASLPPPAPLLAAEQRLVAQLNAGEFSSAAADGAPQLVSALRTALKDAIPVVMKKRQGQELHFVERRNPCGAAVAPDRNRTVPKRVGGQPVESFYPQPSAARGDEGAVVLSMKISDKGCVRSGAILVHSGFHDLDAAALRWMETAEYSPGYANGRAVAGIASMKVLFKLEN
jgi:TonB family protein